MVPIVGKPCMEHIVELLKRHGFEDVIVTVAFLPQAIRSYFGSGETLGVDIGYSVEESPLGTAGSVQRAAGRLDDTFLVISGDALCDVDLTGLVEAHREKGASVTIGLKSVENPLEFGIVVTDEDGRVERFLEKPSWGQVFSDTINTGIYVLEPEVLKHIPHGPAVRLLEGALPAAARDGPADLRPRLRRLLAGHRQPRPVPPGELRRARESECGSRSQGSGSAATSGWGTGWTSTISTRSRGLRTSATTAASRAARTSARTRVLSSSVTVRERGRVVRSMVDSSTYIGRSTEVVGAIVGRSCDLRAHVRVHEGAAIGDEVTVGAESVILPGVRIYPFKEVETGSTLHESLIWESRGTTRVFGKPGWRGW